MLWPGIGRCVGVSVFRCFSVLVLWCVGCLGAFGTLMGERLLWIVFQMHVAQHSIHGQDRKKREFRTYGDCKDERAPAHNIKFIDSSYIRASI